VVDAAHQHFRSRHADWSRVAGRGERSGRTGFPQVGPSAFSSLAHIRVMAAMSSSLRGSTKYFLTEFSKVRLTISAKCRPLLVKLMSDTRPSPWSAPRWRCPASISSWTNGDALVGLTLTGSPDRP